MSNPEKSRKPLIVGIIAAVVILGVLLALVLTNCTAGQGAKDTEPVQTTVGEETPTYNLYWNLDRALYDGKSEAGMSSRKPEADGYFHVRFFIDGEIVVLKVADRKTVNTLEINDIMDLKFDEDGIVVGVIPLDDVPCEQVGWKFYVKSAARTVIKLNSSKTFNGMEVMLDVEDTTGIYDMTGKEGEVGTSIVPISGDRVIAIADLSGKLTHVFVIERPTYMKSFKAECQHCLDTVEWKMWDKTNTLPVESGHYQLQNNIQLKQQMNMAEDANICLDLNGYTVDGAENARVLALYNVGCELALMDTSEAQTGKLCGHGEFNSQGGVVWVRRGAFYMYSGILDARDMTTLGYGAAVSVPTETFFYMYGGTIYGGTTKYKYNTTTGKYESGMGGSVYVAGKFVMYDGTITSGKALGIAVAWDADGTPSSYQRGFGGNIGVNIPGEFIMEGGTIKNGTSTHNGGNIYINGAATVTINGGVITGGKCTGRGRNGGNICVNGSKSVLTINGGYITNGKSYNQGGNVYSAGVVTMNGGYIAGGKCYIFKTGELNAEHVSSNVCNTNGTFSMYGGIVDGGFDNRDTKVDTVQTTMIVGGLAQITSNGKQKYPDLNLRTDYDGVDFFIATYLRDGAKIGVNTATGIFSRETHPGNLDNFYSNVEGVPVVMFNGCLALGDTIHCLCGDKDGHEETINGCDGTLLMWSEWTSTTTMPSNSGNYILTGNVDLTNTSTVKAPDQVINIDLNGFTVKNAVRTLEGKTAGYRLFLIDPAATNTIYRITDTAENGGGTIKSDAVASQGSIFWVRAAGSQLILLSGTIDGSGLEVEKKDGGKFSDYAAGAIDVHVAQAKFVMYGGTVIGGNTLYGGDAIAGEKAGTQIEIYGGTIKASETSPTGVLIRSSADIYIHGGVIEGTVEANNNLSASSLTLSGAPSIEEIYLSMTDGASLTPAGNPALPVINITGELTNTTPISVKTMGNTLGAFTSATVEANVDNFTSASREVRWNAETSTLDLVGLQVSLEHCLCGDKDGHEETINGCDGTVLTWVEWDSTTTMPNTTGNYILTNNVDMTGTVTVKAADQIINIDLNGWTVKNAVRTLEGKTAGYRLFFIDPAATNTIYRITDTAKNGGGTIKSDAVASQGSIFWVRAAGSQLILLSGTIDGSGLEVEKKDGGKFSDYAACAIDVHVAQAKFVMYGGTVIGGNTPYGGDAIAGEKAGTQIEIYGGTIKASETSPTGVLIRSSGDIYIHGGVIEGTVEANNNLSATSLTLSGAPSIEEIYLSMTDGASLTPAENPALPVINITGELTNTTPISVKTMGNTLGAFTSATVEANADNFVAASASRKVQWNAETSTVDFAVQDISLEHCLCGDKDGHEETINGCDGTVLTWTKWTSEDTMPKTTGNYILTGNVDMTTTLNIKAADQIINIDLNGWTVKNAVRGDEGDTSSYRLFHIFPEATNTIYRITDTAVDGGGTIKSDAIYDQGAIFWVRASGAQVILVNGTIDGSDLEVQIKDGGKFSAYAAGVIDLNVDQGKFVMYGGTIIGGNTPYGGDAIAGEKAGTQIEIYGGTIKASETSPTGVLIRSSGDIYIHGGVIEGTVEANNNLSATSLTLSGAPSIEEIYLSMTDGVTLAPAENPALPVINITGELTNTTPISVKVMGNVLGAFTSATVEANADNFTGASIDRKAQWNAETSTVDLALVDVHCLCGDKDGHEETIDGCDGTVLVWTEWTSGDTMPTTTGNYILTGNVDLTTTSTVKAPDQVINIDLNGFTVKNAVRTLEGKTYGYRLFLIDPAATNTIYRITDSAENGGGTIKSDAIYDQGAIFWVRAAGSQLILLGGTIDGSGLEVQIKDGGKFSAYAAGAIDVHVAQAKFVMYGGTIIGGNTPYGGDAIAGEKAGTQIEIYGGTIKASETSPTGVLIRSSGDIYVHGGVIEGTVEANNNLSATSLTLSGEPSIKEIYLSMTDGATLTPAGNPALPVINITGELTNTTPIPVKTMGDVLGAFTSATVEANADKFTAVSTTQNVQWNAETSTLDLIAGGLA